MMSRFPTRPVHDYYMNALRNQVSVRVPHDNYVGYHDWRAWTARKGINAKNIEDNNPKLLEMVLTGEISIKRAYQEIKKKD